MKPQQVFITILALVGAFFLLSLAGAFYNFFFSNSCAVEAKNTFASPNNVHVIYQEVHDCPGTEKVSKLMFQNRSARGHIYLLLESDAVFVAPSGAKFDSVFFSVKWSGDDRATIYYPDGVDVSSSALVSDFDGRQYRKREIDGVKLELIPLRP